MEQYSTVCPQLSPATNMDMVLMSQQTKMKIKNFLLRTGWLGEVKFMLRQNLLM